MAAWTHAQLLCWVCGLNRASRVFEAKVLPDYATDLVEVEPHYHLSCVSTFCLSWSVGWANARDSVMVDDRPLTLGEAQAISGRHLDEEAAA